MVASAEVLVLGVGNILWADEGFGVRALETLARRHAFADTVTLMDGGTQGLALIPAISEHRRLLILDAVDFGGEPASLSVVRDGDIPSFVGARAVSLHQTGMNDVLALAKLTGWVPDAMTLIGVQPVMLEDYGGSLTPPVRARIDEAVALAVQELAAWGYAGAARTDVGEEIVAAALEIGAYEAGRPSADAACRIGDARLLQSLAKD